MTAYKKPQISVLSTRYRNLTPFERDLLSELNSQLTNLNAILNGGIAFADNMDVDIVEYTSNAVANTEDTVPHFLEKTPIGFIVISVDKAGVVYKGGTAWTNANIYLKCSAASTAVKIVVI